MELRSSIDMSRSLHSEDLSQVDKPRQRGKQKEYGEEQHCGEHGSDTPIERIGDLQGNVLRDHDGLATTEQGGRHVGSDREDEHEDAGADEPGLAEHSVDLQESAERARAEP